MAEAKASEIERWLESAGITETHLKLGLVGAFVVGAIFLCSGEASTPAGKQRAETYALRKELAVRREAAYRQCWADANAAAVRRGFQLTPEIIANPGLVNAGARNMYLSANELAQEEICEAGAKLDNGGYSTVFHKSMYKGSDGQMHELD